MTKTTPTTFKIIPYKKGSKSAKALADALGGKRLKEQSSYVPKDSDLLINWGASKFPIKDNYNKIAQLCLNRISNVRRASDKLFFFQHIRSKEKEDLQQDSDLPPFWESKNDIEDSSFNHGGIVVCRTILSGHSGAGIVLSSSVDELVDAPLYVKYIPKKEEYRVHLGRVEDSVKVIAIQRKAMKTGAETVNWKIRNLANGFVYVRQNVCPPAVVIQAATRVFRHSFLDFGAVDVIWNEKAGKAYVLEINTAPGLEGQTVQDYANFFRSL